VEAAARLGVEPGRAAAIEDSTNGLLAARAAGLGVVAIPNRSFPPAPAALEDADVVLRSLHELTPESVEAAVSARGSAA
jgi:beta-phosphoglucomutase-like phosphatase (HAD superfamily)